MTLLEKLRSDLIITERAFNRKWCEIYEENKNVSYATNYTLGNTDEGQNYLLAKLKYEEYFRLMDNKKQGIK